MAGPPAWATFWIDAVGAVGSAGAAVVAVILATRDRKDRLAAQDESRRLRDRERRAIAWGLQAEVTAFKGFTAPSPGWAVAVRHTGVSPVHAVAVTVYAVEGDQPETIHVADHLEPGGVARAVGIPHTEDIPRDPFAYRLHFRDATGFQWMLDERGILEEVPDAQD